MNFTFETKIWKTGNSHVVTIPGDFIETGVVPKDTTLKVTVEVPDTE